MAMLVLSYHFYVHVNFLELTDSYNFFLHLPVNSSYKKAAISDLSEGLNKTTAVMGKVLLFIRHDNVAPL